MVSFICLSGLLIRIKSSIILGTRALTRHWGAGGWSITTPILNSESLRSAELLINCDEMKKEEPKINGKRVPETAPEQPLQTQTTP